MDGGGRAALGAKAESNAGAVAEEHTRGAVTERFPTFFRDANSSRKMS